MSRNESPNAAALRALFGRLTLGFVEKFGGSSDGDVKMPDPVSQADRHLANVVTSKYGDGSGRHALLLDIDHPAWLVKSSTENHYHLYIDVPGGIDHEQYMEVLRVLSDAGVIQTGYRRASMNRGFTSLRFPWVKKEQSDG